MGEEMVAVQVPRTWLLAEALGGEAVAKLDAIGGGDPEDAHSEADGILLSVVPADVRAAYERLVERSEGWWFA